MKLVTWNTQWCCGLDGRVSPRRIVDGARELADFDVLCLQEVADAFDRLPGTPGDQPAQLAAMLPGFRCFFGAAVVEFKPDGRRQCFGNLVATRLPVARVQHHALPWPADGGVLSMPRMCTMVTVLSPLLGPVRVMTTHLEYYSVKQRVAQAQALRTLHDEACALAAAPPKPTDDGSPFQTKVHTPHAVLCGDFNAEVSDAGIDVIVSPAPGSDPAHGLCNAWPLAHGGTPHAPTFRLFDRTYGPDPMACDFVFVSDGLAPHVRRVEVDGRTRASDHQPVVVEFGEVSR